MIDCAIRFYDSCAVTPLCLMSRQNCLNFIILRTPFSRHEFLFQMASLFFFCKSRVLSHVSSLCVWFIDLFEHVSSALSTYWHSYLNYFLKQNQLQLCRYTAIEIMWLLDNQTGNNHTMNIVQLIWKIVLSRRVRRVSTTSVTAAK